MIDQVATEYANGRVVATSYTNDEGVQVLQTNTYTIGSFDYSRLPDKPAAPITTPMWWDKAHQGQESAMNPTYFADAFFRLRGYEQATPDRPSALKPYTLVRRPFNKIALD